MRLTVPVGSAELVACRIAEIGEECAVGAQAGRVFAGDAAIRNARRMPGIDLCRAFCGEPDGAAVAAGGGLTVNGLSIST